MHPAQYLFQEKFSEKEQQLLDELWIVLEEKLEVRKQLISSREIVAEKLNEIDEYERQGSANFSSEKLDFFRYRTKIRLRL